MKRYVYALLLAVPGAALGAGSVVELRSGEPLSACKPRSTAAPARLNIDVSALGYGVTTPCEAVVELYIAPNTNLRSVSGKLQYLSASNEVVLERSFKARLEGQGRGMLQHRLLGEPVADLACRQLSLGLDLQRCDDGKGTSINCGPVRVKGSYVFGRLVVEGDDADLCVD